MKKQRGYTDDSIIFTVFMVGIVICLAAAYLIGVSACNTKAQSFEAHDYSFIAGCMVKHKGKWLPLDNIRGFDDK